MDLPRLVLVPGLDGTGLLFRPFLRVWQGPITVLTHPPDPSLDYEGLLPLLLQGLPTDEPFVLLGESFSGPLVLRIAAQPPPGLQAVILCVSFAKYPLGFLGGLARILARPSLLSLLPRRYARHKLLGTRGTPELDALLEEVLQCAPAAVLAARIRALSRVDATPSLRACRLPLLVLSARSDALVPRRCTAHILRNSPAAQWREFPGPHLLLQTQPEAAAAVLREFIQGPILMTTGQ